MAAALVATVFTFYVVVILWAALQGYNNSGGGENADNSEQSVLVLTREKELEKEREFIKKKKEEEEEKKRETAVVRGQNKQRVQTDADIDLRWIYSYEDCPPSGHEQTEPIVLPEDLHEFKQLANPLLFDREHNHAPHTRWNVFVFEDGYVAPTYCHADVFGQPYTPTHYFQFSMNSPACHQREPPFSAHPESEFSVLASSIYSSYPSAHGHFTIQTLPRLMYLLRKVPEDIPILIPTGGMADKFRDFLVHQLKIPASRFVGYDGYRTYHAQKLYFADFVGLYGNNKAHTRCSLHEVEAEIGKGVPDPTSAPYVLWIHREPGHSRSVVNETEIVDWLKGQFGDVRIYHGTEPLLDTMKLFAGARLIIGPHGAGMTNMLWTKTKATVIELAYRTGMPFPPIFWDVARLTERTYCAMMCEGDYGGTLTCSVSKLESLLKLCLTLSIDHNNPFFTH